MFTNGTRKAMAVVGLLAFCVSTPSYGSISFTNTDGNSFWFDHLNWSSNSATNNFMPPFNSAFPSGGALDANGFYTSAPTDTDIGSLNSSGTGNPGPFSVVFDPTNDPNFNPTDPANTSPPRPTAYGYNDDGYGTNTPAYVIWRLYLSSGENTATNTLTINSGTLILRDSSANNTSSNNYGSAGTGQANIGRAGTGIVNQFGGKFIQEYNDIDLGQTQAVVTANPDMTTTSAPSAGNGTWNYYGGTLEAGLLFPSSTSAGLRLGPTSTGANAGPAFSTTGASSTGTLRIYNTGADGHIRVLNFIVASGSSVGGTNSGAIGNVEFHFGVNTHGTAGIRPIQVNKNLSLNNSTAAVAAAAAITENDQSSRLSIVLDSAPALTAGAPANQGLFDVDFDNDTVGTRNGTSNGTNVFYSADGVTQYSEGATVGAAYGLTQYNWTISYTGKINWSDPDNSLVSSVTGAGTGNDVVLIGSGVQAAVALGDVNGDHVVNTQDVQALMTALSDLPDYVTNNHILSNSILDQIADINGDGVVNNSDIQALISDLANTSGGGQISAVPEPASLVLLALGSIGMGLAAYRRRNLA